MTERVIRPGTATPRPAALWPTAGVAGLIAAAATTVTAALGRALGAAPAVDGEPVALAAFPILTVLGAVLGAALAVALCRWVRRPRRAFLLATAALTALSLVPDLRVEATPGTRAVLMLTHLLAAAIIVPALARQLPRD